MSGQIDLDQPAKYPIVLSDSLAGKGNKELFTSIRYNHKPDPSLSESLSKHSLKPSSPGDSTNFALSFKDGSEEYAYEGSRNAGDGQYVLIFDPIKKHFVLHQLDSSFDMNLTSTPWDQNSDSLRSSYRQIESVAKPRSKSSSQQKSQSSHGDTVLVRDGSSDNRRRKVEKPKKSKPPPRQPTPEAEDEDSDDGLTVEYPGGPPPQRFQPYSLPVPQLRDTGEASEESDVDAEYEDDDDEPNIDAEVLELPSPIANTDADDDLELDLEAELEQALASETGHRGDESSESEEE